MGKLEIKWESGTCFSSEIKVELVEEVWMFMANIGNDVEKHERLDNTDEILLNSLLDVNNNQTIEMSKVFLELKSQHD